MALQVLGHLVFGFHHKPQAHAVTHLGRRQAQRKRARKPQRIEQAGPGAQGVQPLLRPGQVVGFLAGGFQQVAAQLGIARDGGLRRVQGLRAHLTYMVHPHQCAGQAFLGGVECSLGKGGCGRSLHRMGFGEQGAQRGVCSAK